MFNAPKKVHVRPTMTSRLAIAFAALVAVLAIQSPSPVQADGVAPTGFIIDGRGNGHGRGMSQYGALGWAVNYDKTWRQILNFYYRNGVNKVSRLTATEPLLPFGLLTVRLFEDYEARDKDRLQIAMVSDTGSLKITALPDAGSWSTLVAREKSGQTNVWEIWGSTKKKCVTGYVNLATDPDFKLVTGSISPGGLNGGRYPALNFETPNGSKSDAVVPNDLIGVCDPRDNGGAGRVIYYRGSIQAANGTSGENRIVNAAPIDLYLRGVVPRESPASWADLGNGKGIHALRAQSVAARSYAIADGSFSPGWRYSYAKTCDTTNCQVYMGAARRNRADGTSVELLEDVRSNRAITDTGSKTDSDGNWLGGFIIRDANNAIMRTEFTSSNGGRTTGTLFGTRDDPGDNIDLNPFYSWARTFTQDQMKGIYPSVGTITSINATHQSPPDELSFFGGYTVDVTITGTDGVITRSAWQFRSDLIESGITFYSPWFGVTPVLPKDVTDPDVGPILFIGDSVMASLFIGGEYGTIIEPRYPGSNIQALTHRCLVGECQPYFYPDQRDGLQVALSEPTPATAVIGLGYNDVETTYGQDLDRMIGALTEKGVRRIIFVNMSERGSAKYIAMNSMIKERAAGNRRIRIFDWNAYSSGSERARWFDYDGVHLKTTGRTKLAQFIRNKLDELGAAGQLPTAPVANTYLPGLPMYLYRPENNVFYTCAIQIALKERGLGQNLPEYQEIDGKKVCIFGPQTTAAVKAFEAKRKLVVDGVVDNRVWSILTS
jgi:hypothetical protein